MYSPQIVFDIYRHSAPRLEYDKHPARTLCMSGNPDWQERRRSWFELTLAENLGTYLATESADGIMDFVARVKALSV